MEKDLLAEMRCRTFGFIFQRYNLLSNLDAVDNAALPAVYSGLDYTSRTARATKILENLELGNRLKNKPSELSGGQQQRVSIARALMNGGEVILADEPTGALDSKSGEMVMKIIKDLYKKGHTIILVTHDKKIASQASRIIEIKDGEVLSDKRKSDEFYKLVDEVQGIKRSKMGYLKYRFSEAFKMSIQAILSHKMRSLLTMLGIIIGITSVVSVVALGNGSQAKVMENISSMGTNTITILPGTGFGDRRSMKIKSLKIADSEYLSQQGFIDSATPNVSAAANLLYGNYSATASLRGVGYQYFDVFGKTFAMGRPFTEEEVDTVASVVVIDDNARKELFENEPNPIGKVIIFNKKPLKIVGVLEKDKNTGPMSETITLYSPYTTTMRKIKGTDDINSITVKVSDFVNSQVAEDSIEKILTASHRKKDFFMINSDSIKQTIEETTNTMKLMISCIAIISLIVGGIGVMNIMLVSVTERTKEIGIRMAIGAKQHNILEQFLIEAILICMIGGILGIILSVSRFFSFISFADITIFSYPVVCVNKFLTFHFFILSRLFLFSIFATFFIVGYTSVSNVIIFLSIAIPIAIATNNLEQLLNSCKHSSLKNILSTSPFCSKKIVSIFKDIFLESSSTFFFISSIFIIISPY